MPPDHKPKRFLTGYKIAGLAFAGIGIYYACRAAFSPDAFIYVACSGAQFSVSALYFALDRKRKKEEKLKNEKRIEEDEDCKVRKLRVSAGSLPESYAFKDKKEEEFFDELNKE